MSAIKDMFEVSYGSIEDKGFSNDCKEYLNTLYTMINPDNLSVIVKAGDYTDEYTKSIYELFCLIYTEIQDQRITEAWADYFNNINHMLAYKFNEQDDKLMYNIENKLMYSSGVKSKRLLEVEEFINAAEKYWLQRRKNEEGETSQ